MIPSLAETPPMPGPLSPDELLERADRAGRARVVSVHRIPDHPGRIAKLRFYDLTKGTPKFDRGLLGWLPWGRTVLVRTRSAIRGVDGRPMPGEWSDGYRAGDVVITHLVWDESMRIYSTVWWNAVWLAPLG
jgi:hypothetical protein